MYLIHTNRLEMIYQQHTHGATIGSRTRDLIFTIDTLYQLSYRGLVLKQIELYQKLL